MSLGLDDIGNLSGLLDNKASGVPLELSLDLIDEDPNQPRNVFDEAKLNELAETIKNRGVKTPISVRPSDTSGRYVINHGARRFRASKIAEKSTIPAFIDTKYTAEDQIVENIQRDNLTPREVAEFIDKRLKEGMKKGEIAKVIGKSNAYVSQHINLLNMPKAIAEAFNSGRCQDITVISELMTAYKQTSEEVTKWLADESLDINRSTVRLLREYIDESADKKSKQTPQEQQEESGASVELTEAGAGVNTMSGENDEQIGKTHNEHGLAEYHNHSMGIGEQSDPPQISTDKSEKDAKPADPEKIKRAIVQIEIYGRPGQLILNKRPSSHGNAWMKYEDEGEEFEGTLEQVKVTAIIEG
jgi:ParB family chromosome partitioning protein